ncbi:MAG: DNA polymerase III subunit gamma/tau [Parcubacteria group bacterium]|nr:DNA polymerase III subunit gamma/tau [Parcubacteria group bacterium]
MTDTALYRKYRPQTFDDVLGQDHIVGPLRAAVKSGAITHSYLFFGSRGTGKTSVARILARDIGCVPEDVYEMDAASNRGIDDVRELREGVKTLPFRSPYKVYIIDEVHMLTKEAFNALLKTLEEPPKHAVFVLATTEIEKVPETIVSRCETHTFKKPPVPLLARSAADIAQKEGFRLEAPAADLIALLGDGSFRDMLGVLQKVLRFAAGSGITHDDVARVTDTPSQETVNEVIRALAEGDSDRGLRAVARAAEANVDFSILLILILKKVRTILLLRHAPSLAEGSASEYTPDDFAFLKNYAGTEGRALNSGALLALLDAHSATGRAAMPQLPLELALIRLAGERGK